MNKPISLFVALALYGGMAAAQVVPMAPTNLLIDGGTTVPSGGNWPQPPMAGMPTVNAPSMQKLSDGKTSLIIGSGGSVVAAGDGVGAFRLSCRPSHMAFDDPLVYPGNFGRAHHHTFFGNTAMDAATNLANVRAVGGSTCNGGSANKSGYWVPTMVDTRTGTPIIPYSIQIYYKSGYNAIPRSEIQPFPAGLRMIAGMSMKSTPLSDSEVHHEFHCHYDGGNSGPGLNGQTIPNCPYTPNPDPQWFSSGTTVWAQLHFPNCWDGKNLDSADHKSHMAYSGGGRCPSTHPVAITSISFNVLYAVRQTDDLSRWKLSSDMTPSGTPGGYSFHGDWVNGWDEDIERAWLNNCVKAAIDCHSNNLGDGRGLNP